MISKRGPDLIPVNLTIKSQGETLAVEVTYHNRTPDEVQEAAKQDGTNIVLFLVNAWNLPYDLTDDGVKEMEQCRPGTAAALVDGYFGARQSELVKN